MLTKPITIGDYTFEDIVGIEVRVTDKAVRGHYPSEPGYGPDKPLIKFSEEAQYMLALLDRIEELETELGRYKLPITSIKYD